MREFLLQLPHHQPVAPGHYLADEAGVIVDRVEVAAVPQHEGLVQDILQTVVGLLGHAVFMRLPRMAAAVCCVFPSILFCLNSLTCWSVINPVPPYRMNNRQK
ncbi:MAG: hypothetical protein J4G14_15205 [Dehalococcoidia bacterium]|nr:hypothetical protein [Dehalococcoidia bacterium]